MSPRPPDGPERGFGSSERSGDVEPGETAGADEQNDRTGAREIPIGMPGDPRTLAELKRRANEPDPDPVDEDLGDDI